MNNYTTTIEELEQEVEIDFFKASGPGGQNVNKRETAVRVRHLPSGIVIEAQSERTQGANRRVAMERLRERLLKLNKPKKKRIATRVPRREKEKRLAQKHQKSERKKLRNLKDLTLT